MIANAQRKLGKKGGKYHLFENNCEHFAIKCKVHCPLPLSLPPPCLIYQLIFILYFKTGKSKCWQSLKYKLAGGLILLSSLVYHNLNYTVSVHFDHNRYYVNIALYACIV